MPFFILAALFALISTAFLLHQFWTNQLAEPDPGDETEPVQAETGHREHLKAA
jgi:hypothetical protein